jgi:magnesium chelatase family protein
MCGCAPLVVERYLARVSGPLLDRIDIHVDVPAVAHQELSGRSSGDPSAVIRERVARARQRQLERFAERPGVYANAHMGPCKITSTAEALLKSAMTRLRLSARAYHRVLKIARTVADLEGLARIETHHVSEAVQYRRLDRRQR